MHFQATTLSILTTAALATVAAADCTRDALFAAANLYVEAQAAGSVAGLQKLISASNFTYMENNKAATLASGLLTKALKLDHNRSIADTTQCASYTELVSTAGPYVIGTQIRFTPDASSILSIDTIHATKGDWFFNAATTLSYVSKETWAPLDASQRSSRAAIQAAGDAYLDMWSNATAKAAVPWSSTCQRVEGSMHFSPCTLGAPNGGGTKNGMRRYVIDEVLGSGDILCAFGGSMPDSHEFRLINGKLELVHTITV